MKRICVVSVDFLPLVGGISFMLHHLAECFQQAGTQTLVWAPKRAGDNLLQGGYETRWDAAYRSGTLTRAQQQAEDRRIATEARRLFESFQPDAILLGHVDYYGPGVQQAARERNLPVGLFTYGFELRSRLLMHDPLWRRVAGTILRRPTQRQRMLRTIARAQRVFAISRYTAALAGAASRPILTGCGLPREIWEREFAATPRFDPAAKKALRRELGWDDAPTAGFVGRLVKSKNVAGMLQALPYLHGVSAVVAGDGPERRELERWAEALGIASRVRWLGAVSEETKWKALRAMDVFCLLSQELPGGPVEGFGIVLLEAAAAGTPALAARSGGMPDAVEDGHSGVLCDGADPKSIASAIQGLLADTSRAAALVTAAREAIRSRFNWETIAAKVLHELEQAART